MTASTLATKFRALADHVQGNPAAARATFKAKVRLDQGTQCSAFVRRFPALVIDEPPYLGGNDAGPNPVEVLLVSLGACQEIAYSIFANMMGIELDSVTVALKGHLDTRGLMGEEGVSPGYQKIEFETRIESRADPEAIAELVRTVESRCPTLDTIKRPVEVQGNVILNGEPIATA